MRPEIPIVIPVPRESAELQAVIDAISAHTTGYRLHVQVDPGLNVSECRQAAMDDISGRYICFMDDDAHQLNDGWLDEMYAVLMAAPDAVVVYGGEQWGTDPAPALVDPTPETPWERVGFGPAACMLIDRTRLPLSVKWCVPLGLANGWLGGDFEEVDYANQITAQGGKLYRATRTLFSHQGGKTSAAAFQGTDRSLVIGTIRCLLQLRGYDQAADPDWWSELRRVPASPADDCAFSPSVVNPMRVIFRDTVLRNGLSRFPMFKRMGIMD